MARPCSSLFLGAAVAVALVVLGAVPPSALAGDPDYLQDLCVADLNSGKLHILPSTLPLHLYLLDTRLVRVVVRSLAVCPVTMHIPVKIFMDRANSSIIFPFVGALFFLKKNGVVHDDAISL